MASNPIARATNNGAKLMSLILETKRLILRPFQASDCDPFVTYRNDPLVAQYQGWDTPYSLAQASQFVEAMGQSRPGVPGEWYQFALELKASGAMIGDCAFYLLAEDTRQAEIGFTLARPYQGQGYGTESVTRLLAYLFETFALHRVQANCDVENIASMKLMERLGMRREAHFVENVWYKGRWSSEYWYGLLRCEWLAWPQTGAPWQRDSHYG
jgi:aminoglycoside 6'-N-acetyltransferase